MGTWWHCVFLQLLWGEAFQNHFEPAVYVCAKCGYGLFSSRSKYEHSSPWPAFTETIHDDSVAKQPERNQLDAFKVSCGKCGPGLGHEFLNDGPKRGQSRF
ncbi:methionine-R-sulfoxide reductase B1-like [Echinops telfairi]|uniref:Methionine-R-sulfoxide reductase B1-like n=1 Tax=Echinops telfairi TaxID=9371 RepID=A0AC55CQS9_ECHTE|nr:methionine-R-sulfoxide reductase B1-like [Echinops telfairi]